MEQCPICFLDLESGIKEVSCCKQKFHLVCYNTWISKNPTCPMCREIVIVNKDKNFIKIIFKLLFSSIFLIWLCYMIYGQVFNTSFLS